MSKKSASKNYNDLLWTGKPRNFLGLALNFTRYIITENKLITSKGLFSIHEDEIMLYRVVDKSIRLKFSERIFGCGTIVLHVKDSDTPEKLLKGIRHPRKILALLDQVIDNTKTKYMAHGKEMYGAMGGGHYHDLDVDDNGVPDALE